MNCLSADLGFKVQDGFRAWNKSLHPEISTSNPIQEATKSVMKLGGMKVYDSGLRVGGKGSGLCFFTLLEAVFMVWRLHRGPKGLLARDVGLHQN